MRNGLKTLSLLLIILGSLSSSWVWAQEKPGAREREALRRVQQQLQQVRQEKSAAEEKLASVEKEKTALKEDRDKLAAQVGSAQARAKAETAKVQKSQASLDSMSLDKQTLQTAKVDLEKQLADLTVKLATSQKELSQVQAKQKQSLSTLVVRDQQIAACEQKNVALYRHGRDLIDQCRDRSATDAVLRMERFTGIKRVEIENMLEEYRDRLDAEKSVTGDLKN